MKSYESYKDINMKRDFFNKRVRRVVIKTAVAFCGGALVSLGLIAILNNARVEKGMGGFETAGVPEVLIEDRKAEEIAAAAKIEIEKTPVEKTVSLKIDKSVENDDMALLEQLEEDELGENDSEMTAELFSDDYNTSDDLELCYYTYRVKKGDMIGFIADSFGITQDTIISVNNIHQSRLLQIGQYLKIPSMPGIIYTVRNNGETVKSVAKKYDVNAEKCAKANNLELEASFKPGETVFVPDAQLDWVTIQEINGDLFHKPIHGRYYLSSYYGWRSHPFSGKRSYHSGMDMACPQGTPIYAALGGTVTSVGYNQVYGNYVIITHHSGYKTLYGHMSKQLVTKGKYVDTNTRIGLVGSTGMSTGPHLHFTVYKNGKTVNPAALWR